MMYEVNVQNNKCNMTQVDKELLLRDLSARLPYGVIVQVKDWTTLDAELKTSHIRLFQDNYLELKPYLRPMDSMTEEEEFVLDETRCWTQLTLESYDWLLAHHFDFRGLIEKGLAIKVTEENNPYKK